MGKLTRIISDEWTGKLPELLGIDLNPVWCDREVNSNKLTKPIPKDFLNGVTIEVDHFGIKEYEIRNDKDSYLNLEMTSWVGISPGAVHSYGTLTIYGLDVGQVGETSISCGYLGAPSEELPIAMQMVNFQIKIVRPITQKDLDHQGGDRYHGYRIGEYTKDWWETEDLEKEAKRIAKKYFPDYRLEIEDRT